MSFYHGCIAVMLILVATPLQALSAIMGSIDYPCRPSSYLAIMGAIYHKPRELAHRYRSKQRGQIIEKYHLIKIIDQGKSRVAIWSFGIADETDFSQVIICCITFCQCGI